ncbi:MAG: CcdB family protein [Hyphomicrobium sp.]|jgi:toxin CcdB
MRQYDVYRNPGARTRKVMPFLLVLQSDVVAGTGSVVVAALTAELKTAPSRLYPTFEIGGATYTLLTPDLASVPRLALVERVTSLEQDWSRITAALDILFKGV